MTRAAAFTFHDYTLRDAEYEIVGACIDHESALRIALAELPLDDFRGEMAAVLRDVFYVLAGWLDRGTYDPATNRERLEVYFTEIGFDDIWCPFGRIDEYVTALCQAVVISNQLLDNAVAAQQHWQKTNPLSLFRPAPTPAARRRGVPKREGGAAGIMIDFSP